MKTIQKIQRPTIQKMRIEMISIPAIPKSIQEEASSLE